MRRSRIGTRLFHALSLVVIFVLVSQPIAVAARPLPASAPSPLDTLASSGDLYLTNASLASSHSAELAVALDRIQSTPLDKVPEEEITAARQTAWQTAEAAATALGTVDSLADTIELLADGASPALDLAQAASQGLPEETRAYLQSVSGLTEEQVADVETDIHDTVSVRQSIAQNGLPAEYVDQLTQAGFTSAEIDAIANALGSRGLGNTNITTRLAQFRASRDELASARTRALFASIHLLGRQVASRQVQGIQPEEVSQEELQELATDEMRLLIHVAHIDQMWGQDPNLDVGEGDWWFIERYATRMSERLEALILKTHNRALVVDLLIAMQVRTLALSARAGDAAYVKAELDGLAGLLEHQLETVGFVSSQQDTDNLVSTWLVRVSGKPVLREQVWWPVSAGQRERIVQTNQARLSHGKTLNALMLAGQVEEYNENNNRMTLIFAGGLPYGDALAADIAPAVFGILDQVNLENVGDWLYAILTGDTDNPLLLAASAGLSMLPILGLVPDLYSLMADPSTWVKALSLFGIVSGLVEGFTFVTGIAPISLGAAISKGASSVLRGLYHVGQFVASARPVLDGLNLRQAFELACQLVDVAARGIKVSVNTIEEAIAALNNIFKQGMTLWNDFCAFVTRVKIEGLIRLGFDDGAWLVGGVIGRGMKLSDEAIESIKDITNNLSKRGISLSNDAADGLGIFGKELKKSQLDRLIQGVEAYCTSTAKQFSGARFKLSPSALNSSGDCIKGILETAKRQNLNPDTLKKLADQIDCADLGGVLGKGLKESSQAVSNTLDIFETLSLYKWSKESLDAMFRFGKTAGNDEVLRNLLTRMSETEATTINEQIVEIVKRLDWDAPIKALILEPEPVRNGVIEILRKMYGGNYGYFLGWDFQLSRAKHYGGQLASVEQREIIAQTQMAYDLVLLSGEVVEVKFWRATTLNTTETRNLLIKQLTQRVHAGKKVILEFGKTKEKCIETQDIIKLISDLSKEGIEASDVDRAADVFIELIP